MFSADVTSFWSVFYLRFVECTDVEPVPPEFNTPGANHL